MMVKNGSGIGKHRTYLKELTLQEGPTGRVEARTNPSGHEPSQLTIPPQQTTTSQLIIAKEGWFVHGTYEEGVGVVLDFTVHMPDGITILFSQTDAPMDSFFFMANVRGSYILAIQNVVWTTVDVNLDMSRDGWITFL